MMRLEGLELILVFKSDGFGLGVEMSCVCVDMCLFITMSKLFF